MLKDAQFADFKISDSTPKLREVYIQSRLVMMLADSSLRVILYYSQIQEIIGRDVNTKAVVACFLIREGADLKLRNILRQTPLEGCTDPVLATVIATFAEEHAGSVFCLKVV